MEQFVKKKETDIIETKTSLQEISSKNEIVKLKTQTTSTSQTRTEFKCNKCEENLNLKNLQQKNTM